MPPASPQSRTEGNEQGEMLAVNVLKWIAIGGAIWFSASILVGIAWALVKAGKR